VEQEVHMCMCILYTKEKIKTSLFFKSQQKKIPFFYLSALKNIKRFIMSMLERRPESNILICGQKEYN